jgi:hypothetical protein
MMKMAILKQGNSFIVFIHQQISNCARLNGAEEQIAHWIPGI